MLKGDPSIEELSKIFHALVEKNLTFIQLSGGEPLFETTFPPSWPRPKQLARPPFN